LCPPAPTGEESRWPIRRRPGRTRTVPGAVQPMAMKKGTVTRGLVGRGETETLLQGLPQASMRFRRRAWRTFQRALDPLAAPKQLPTKRPH
jgi:hypothetical protein